MSEFMLELEFKDTNSKISFDLNKNNLFHGLNGKGKTRILQSIVELCKLNTSNDISIIISIINTFNLKGLKINHTDYEKLFSEKEEVDRSYQVLSNEFINENKSIIETYLQELSFISRKNNFSFEIYEIDKLLNEGKKFLNGKFIYLEDFEVWLRKTKKVINKKFSKEKFSFLYKNIEDDLYFNRKVPFEFQNLDKMYRFLIRKLEDTLYNRNIISERNLKEEKDKIIEKLNTETVVYISPNISENYIILEIIKKEIQDKKIEFGTNIWNSILNNKKYITQTHYDIENFLFDWVKKLNNINCTLEKYTNIKLFFDNEANIKVVKSNTNIEFEKLSSGEKRIILLFLYVVFSKEKIILIDEPEISLSLNYQSKFVDDIVRLADDKKIMMATHAPYIYDDCKANGFELIKV